MTKREQPFFQAAGVLPGALRRMAEEMPEGYRQRCEEFRLRVGRPMSVVLDGEESFLSGPEVSRDDLRALLEIASRGSAHTVLERVRQGFVTVRGGHRIGLCGTAAVEGGGIVSLRFLSSAAVRVAREIPGPAAAVLPALREGAGIASTLILAPPGAGKTTFLRDLIRALSDGEGGPPLRVGVADERGELAALWEGKPELDLGARTDVLEGCPKAAALELLLRGMNPQVLAVDEITAPADAAAILQAAGCGVALLATAHGKSVKDISLRPVYRTLLERGVFQKLVLLRRDAEGVRTAAVEELA